MKNKPFFVVKLNEEVDCEEFNSKFGKSKKVKARVLADDAEQKNNITEDDYRSIEDVQKPAEKVQKEASPE